MVKRRSVPFGIRDAPPKRKKAPDRRKGAIFAARICGSSHFEAIGLEVFEV